MQTLCLVQQNPGNSNSERTRKTVRVRGGSSYASGTQDAEVTKSLLLRYQLRHPYGVLVRSVLTDTHPPQERVATPVGSMSPTLFEQWCEFWFYVALNEEPDKWKCFETEHTITFSSLSEKTRKNNRLQRSLQRQHFLLSYLKTLSVGQAGLWTHDPPLGRPASESPN